MGLKQNIYDPCLFTGSDHDPEDPTDSLMTIPLTLGLYVDDFVFFSTSDEVEKKFTPGQLRYFIFYRFNGFSSVTSLIPAILL